MFTLQIYVTDLSDTIERKLREWDLYLDGAESQLSVAEMIYSVCDVMVYVSRLSDEMTFFQTSK